MARARIGVVEPAFCRQSISRGFEFTRRNTSRSKSLKALISASMT
jgi:hypothetical protein